MGFTTGNLPPVDPGTFDERPFFERIRISPPSGVESASARPDGPRKPRAAVRVALHRRLQPAADLPKLGINSRVQLAAFHRQR
jgi:hypothetical protein